MNVRAGRTTGFSMVEMLVVIAVLGILAAIAMTGLSAARRYSFKVKCMNNLSQIGKALTYYASRNNGALPSLDARYNDNGTAQLVQPRVPWHVQLQRDAGGEDLRELFVCPMQASYGGYRPADLIWTSNHLSYGLNCDVKKADGVPYRVNQTNFAVLTAADKDFDVFAMSEIKAAGEFILAADSDRRDIANEAVLDVRAKYRIAPRALAPPELDIGRPHMEMGNVLYGDLHVGQADLGIMSRTELWTLPAD